MTTNNGGTFDPLEHFGIHGIVYLIINALLFFMGVGLICVGALAIQEVSKINTENIKPLIDLFTTDSVQAVGRVNDLSITLIVIGVVLILVLGLSIAAAYFQKKYILIQYANLVLVLLVMKIVLIALWFTMESKVETDMQGKMITSLKAHFEDDTTTSSNSLSNAWNYMYMTVDCCAVNSVQSTTNDFDQTSWCTTSGSCQATSSQIPKTCCLNVDENTYTTAPNGCHASVSSGTYNSEGCYDVLKKILLRYSSSIIGLIFTTIALEIAAVVLVILILGKDKVGCLSRCPTKCFPSNQSAGGDQT